MTTRLILVGGFLGAGKTTLLLQAARLLSAQGYRIGVITNDQGHDLVDSAMVVYQDIPIQEVSGGCFCCHFPDFMGSIHQLQQTVKPDIILAEPVGSCTDLAATILRPLYAHYPQQFDISPLTVLADVSRDTAVFPQIVDYLYDKQLAEAEIIVLNKVDLLTAEQHDRKLNRLSVMYPHARLISLSARSGQGVADWLALILGQTSDPSRTLELDYGKYAEAEAALGWLNAQGVVYADKSFSAIDWVEDLIGKISIACVDQNVPIAHVKLYATTDEATLKASSTQTSGRLSWDLKPDDSEVCQVQFTLNARVNIDPDTLKQLVYQTVEAIKPQSNSQSHFTHFECFSPLPPEPTFRL